MTIEFLLDEFEEKKKKELVEIDNQLSKKPKKKTDKKTLFLRNFTLSLMGQYGVKSHHYEQKGESIDRLNKELSFETQKLSDSIYSPIQRMMPPVPDRIISHEAGRMMDAPLPINNISIPKKISVLEIPRPISSQKPNEAPKPDIVPIPE